MRTASSSLANMVCLGTGKPMSRRMLCVPSLSLASEGGDGAGIAGNRSLNAFLILAVAELHQAVLVQSQPGNVARHRGIDQRLRAGSEFARWARFTKASSSLSKSKSGSMG